MVAPPAGKQPNPGLLAINQTFKQFGEYPGTTFGTTALMCIPLAFLGMLSALNPGPATKIPEVVIGTVFSAWVGYTMTLAVGMYSQDRDPKVAALLKMSLSSGLIRYGLTSILVSVVVGLIALVTLVPFLMSIASVDATALRNLRLSEAEIFRLGSSLLFSLPLLLGVLIYTYLRWGLSPTASALENSGPVAGMRYSWQVTRGRMWHFFVLTLVTGAITLAVSIFVAGPAAMVSVRPASPAPDRPFSAEMLRDQLFGQPLGPAPAVITGISVYLSAVLLTPLSAGTLANFYLLARKPDEPAGDEPPPPAPPVGPAEDTPEDLP